MVAAQTLCATPTYSCSGGLQVAAACRTAPLAGVAQAHQASQKVALSVRAPMLLVWMPLRATDPAGHSRHLMAPVDCSARPVVGENWPAGQALQVAAPAAE